MPNDSRQVAANAVSCVVVQRPGMQKLWIQAPSQHYQVTHQVVTLCYRDLSDCRHDPVLPINCQDSAGCCLVEFVNTMPQEPFSIYLWQCRIRSPGSQPL
jgi:hypothetical protein